MQIKLSVLLIVLILIFVLFHYSDGEKKVNLPMMYHQDLRPWDPYVENYSAAMADPVAYSNGTTPVVYSDSAYGPETGFTSSFAPGGDAIVYSDGTPMQEITPIDEVQYY